MMSSEWQTEAFRGSLVRKLEEAIRESGVQNQKTAVEMENQVFQRAKSKEEYLSFVAKLILHVKQQSRNNAAAQQQQSADNSQMRMMNPNMAMQQNRMQMQQANQQQQQMMMQQQQQQQQQQHHQMQLQRANVRARLQQTQQQQQQQQQLQPGARMSQLQQALQQRPQGGGGFPAQDMQQQQQPNMHRPNIVRGMGPGQFQLRPGMPPSSSGGSGGVPQGPSPLPYAQSPQGQNPSPGGAPIPSPVGQARSNSLAPSPSSQVNTPLNPNQEEREYLEKLKSLEKYKVPLERIILRIGNEDNEKLLKMKKLLDIMSNPDKRMPLVTLQKCEDVLKRMQLETTESESLEVGLTGGDKNPLLEAVYRVQTVKKSMAVNHCLSSTFHPPLETMLGPEITLPPPLSDSPPPPADSEEDIPDLLQGEIARLDHRFRVWLDPSQPCGHAASVQMVCQLDDKDLPAVPPLRVTIPRNYPDSPPESNIRDPDYLTTPFLREVSGSLGSRLDKMTSLHTLSQLLTAWELSVRSACVPSPVKQRTTVMTGGLINAL